MATLNSSQKLRVLHTINHLAAVYGLLYGTWWMWLVSFMVWNFIGTFGISIGFHRYLSHKSFETHPYFERFCVFVGCLATGGSPIAWVGSHRLHHINTDSSRDPHASTIIGSANTYFHLWPHFIIPRSVINDLLEKKYLRWIQRNYFKIIFAWLLVLLLIDPLAMVFIYSVPACLAFHAFGILNLFGHKFGYRSFETPDNSKNNWFANILTCGEGWHNNHHKFPSNYRIGLEWWELDISAWVLENLHLMKSYRPINNAQLRLLDKKLSRPT